MIKDSWLLTSLIFMVTFLLPSFASANTQVYGTLHIYDYSDSDGYTINNLPPNTSPIVRINWKYDERGRLINGPRIRNLRSRCRQNGSRITCAGVGNIVVNGQLCTERAVIYLAKISRSRMNALIVVNVGCLDSSGLELRAIGSLNVKKY